MKVLSYHSDPWSPLNVVYIIVYINNWSSLLWICGLRRNRTAVRVTDNSVNLWDSYQPLGKGLNHEGVQIFGQALAVAQLSTENLS